MDKLFTNSKEENRKQYILSVIYIWIFGYLYFFIGVEIFSESGMPTIQRVVDTVITTVWYIPYIMLLALISCGFKLYKRYPTIKIKGDTLEYYVGEKLKQTHNLQSVKIAYIQKEKNFFTCDFHKRHLIIIDDEIYRMDLHYLNREKFNLLIEKLSENYEVTKV